MSIIIGQNIDYAESNISENFHKLLECTKLKLQANFIHKNKEPFWKEFEIDVKRAAESSSIELNLSWEIQYVSGHKFPDIVAKINEKQALGIEVKTLTAKNNSWKIMGGSIMESTRIPNVNRISVFCAKQNPFQIKYRPFEECVESVAITHSPRYMLDMELAQGNSLFKKLHKPYDDIRQMQNPFEAFKSYLIESKNISFTSENNENTLWWYSPNIQEVSLDDLNEQQFADNLIDSKIKFWNSLSKEEQLYYKCKMLVEFPNVINGDYSNACKWLLKKNGIINPSFRDLFSAGGKEIILGVKVSKIIANIYKWKLEIINVLKESQAPCATFKNWKQKIYAISKFQHVEKEILLQLVQEIEQIIYSTYTI